VLFGQGGTAVELIADRAVALPPLNSVLARDLVSRTRVHKLFQAHRGGPGVDSDAVELTLVKLSQMAIDIAEIVELDINPLLADENGVLALDARRAMAFVAVTTGEGAKAETLGVARAHSDPDNITAEFAVHVRSDLKGRGLGSLLLEKLIRYCRSRGTRRLVGEILSDNEPMLHLARASGFHLQSAREGCLRATLDLQPTAAT
jgi:GNAT superfamily N-acetyltransferase